MKILFCDLCNESVPQSDLDGGRAFMRKGRVVCGKCDRLMSQREEASFAQGAHGSHGSSYSFGSVGGSVGGSGGGSGGGSAGPTHANLTTLGPAPMTHEAGHATHHHPHLPHAPHARARGGNSGLAVALFAMALTAGAFYWLTERSDKLSRTAEERYAKLERNQLDIDQRAIDRSNELESTVLVLEEQLRQSAEAERKAIENRFQETQQKQATALASLGDINTAITDLKGVLPSLTRHDQELLAAQQKIALVESRALALDAALADLRKELEARPAAGPASAGGAAAVPVGTPAWMGLVQQLESANNGDRWVAVSSLGETRDPAVAEYLLPRLKDVDIFVRMATARVLGDLKSPKATGALIEALNDQDSSVREAAYISLCAVSNKNFPFDAHQESADRAKKIKVWQDWWKKSQEDGGA